MKMPFHNRTIQAYPDAMHTVNDAVEHIFNLLIGKEDSVKVRKVETKLNWFGVLIESTARKRKRGQKNAASNVSLTSAPFRLSL